MSIALQNSVVYGPIQSRRLGVSLGINILPTEAKFCLSDCLYCQYGWTDLRKVQMSKLDAYQEFSNLLARVGGAMADITRKIVNLAPITSLSMNIADLNRISQTSTETENPCSDMQLN